MNAKVKYITEKITKESIFDEPVISLLDNKTIEILLKHAISLDEVRCSATSWVRGDTLRVMASLNEDTDT